MHGKLNSKNKLKHTRTRMNRIQRQKYDRLRAICEHLGVQCRFEDFLLAYLHFNCKFARIGLPFRHLQHFYQRYFYQIFSCIKVRPLLQKYYRYVNENMNFFSTKLFDSPIIGFNQMHVPILLIVDLLKIDYSKESKCT